jgi:hypothetical protein
MGKGFVIALACVVLLAGCTGGTAKAVPGEGDAAVSSPERLLTVEEMTREAEQRYEQAITLGLPGAQAVEEAASFLRRQKNVAVVKVLNNDSLRVVFTDGNDLFMLLGKDRM